MNVVAADARRRGVRVLRAAGAEFEAGLSFAGLHQVLHPVLGRLDEGEHGVLRTARRAETRRGACEELAVSEATLDLLASVAAAEPLLIVVDDELAGPASSVVLAYVARRAGATGMALIATMRTGERTPFERGGLDRYELQPLPDEEATALLAERFRA